MLAQATTHVWTRAFSWRVKVAEHARPRLEQEEEEPERGDDPGREHQVHHDASL
jgi:hypothetical protein